MDTYKIVRYKFKGSNSVMQRGLTLKQAQAHCSNEKTQAKKDKEGHRAWFDGYTSE